MALKTYIFVVEDPIAPTGGIIIREYDRDEVRQSPANEDYTEKREHRVRVIEHRGYDKDSAAQVKAYYRSLNTQAYTGYTIDVAFNEGGIYTITITEDLLYTNNWTLVINP
jgi:C-terminal processing protease CtpA/Prc